ncbi:MAG TPA: hypothetical protein VGQ55_13370 [Pyrinomonadaceae bacterium]|jgi:hypothetical protein|nr:hypothetical protein [Pyrinomonadaceae bacterium]
MATHWEQFKGGPTRPSNEYFGITINNKSDLTINRFTMKTLGNPEAVVLLFDKRESVIGLVSTNRRNADAFPVIPKNGGQNWVIHTAPFCRHFGIVIDRTERFDQPEIDNEGILRLDLKTTHNVSIPKRPGA